MNEKIDTCPDVTKLHALAECYNSLELSVQVLPDDCVEGELAIALIKCMEECRLKIQAEMENLALVRYEGDSATFQILNNQIIVTQD